MCTDTYVSNRDINILEASKIMLRYHTSQYLPCNAIEWHNRSLHAAEASGHVIA